MVVRSKTPRREWRRRAMERTGIEPVTSGLQSAGANRD